MMIANANSVAHLPTGQAAQTVQQESIATAMAEIDVSGAVPLLLDRVVRIAHTIRTKNKMISLQIDITDLQDLKIASNTATLKDIKAVCEKVLSEGGQVIIKRTYVNAPDDFIRGFKVQDLFAEWWDQLLA